jgi:hypothetical protein
VQIDRRRGSGADGFSFGSEQPRYQVERRL